MCVHMHMHMHTSVHARTHARTHTHTISRALSHTQTISPSLSRLSLARPLSLYLTDEDDGDDIRAADAAGVGGLMHEKRGLLSGSALLIKVSRPRPSLPSISPTLSPLYLSRPPSV